MKEYLKASAFVLLASFMLGAGGCSLLSPDIDYSYYDDGFGGTIIGIEPSGTSGAGSESGSASGNDAPPTEVVLVDNSFRFTRDNMPILDGSAAMTSLAIAMENVLMSVPMSEASEDICFHRTAGAYQSLISGSSDLILVPSASEDIQQQIADSGVDLEFVPIAKEGLVFYVSDDNPVSSLTVDQIRGIYDGTITNWSEVGGEDMEIVAYSRPGGTGAQAVFDTFITGSDILAEETDADAEEDEDAAETEVSGDDEETGDEDEDPAGTEAEDEDTEDTDALTEETSDDETAEIGDDADTDNDAEVEEDEQTGADETEGSEEAVFGYDNAPGAIGYSLYHYVNEMNGASDGYKIIEVNGVMPSFDSIHDGSYPCADHYFAVIRAEEEEDSPARILRNWLVSTDGQSLVWWEGFVPMEDVWSEQNG